MNIDVPLWDRTEDVWKLAKRAEIVDVAPHLTGTFVVHRTVWEEMFDWIVSNVETGARVARGWTRAEAVEQATEILAGKTDAQLQRAMRNADRYQRRKPKSLPK